MTTTLPRLDQRDLFFTPADAAKMGEQQRALVNAADGLWRSKRAWADLVGCSEHAFSARLSECRRKGWVGAEKRKDTPGKLGVYEYRVWRS